MTPDLQNKIILITGASRGIGRSIALELAKAGYPVIVHYNASRAAAEAVAADIKARGDTPQQTDVVTLNAEVLEVVTEGNVYVASVRFSGMLREQVGAEAFRFEEVWNLFKPEQGGWLLAGIQQVPVTQAS